MKEGGSDPRALFWLLFFAQTKKTHSPVGATNRPSCQLELPL
jgi:hypothetical protein